ncbi:MAG: DUF4416 family protein [Candidatus Omnitrophota bacterium]
MSAIRQILIKKFGPADSLSPVWPFDQTGYYASEMGQNLKRQFVSFARLGPAERLIKTKLTTNALEQKFSHPDRRRRVNIDPGYVSLSKLVLATTKNYAHRIYVGKGIYEEITLFYKERGFQPAPWTYPDYRQETYIRFFNDVRTRYRQQIEKIHGPAQISPSP